MVVITGTGETIVLWMNANKTVASEWLRGHKQLLKRTTQWSFALFLAKGLLWLAVLTYGLMHAA